MLELTGSNGTQEVPFLPEHVRPLNFFIQSLIFDQEIPESRPRSGSDKKPAAATASSSGDQAKVDHLMALGFSEQQVRQALQSCNGNAEMAAGLLFESSQ